MQNEVKKIPNFYHSVDGYLFWVAGYTGDNSTDVVSEKITHLIDGAGEFANIAGCHAGEVKTMFVDNSRRFKYMRVFYIESKIAPETAFCFTGEDFTMSYILTKM